MNEGNKYITILLPDTQMHFCASILHACTLSRPFVIGNVRCEAKLFVSLAIHAESNMILQWLKGGKRENTILLPYLTAQLSAQEFKLLYLAYYYQHSDCYK